MQCKIDIFKYYYNIYVIKTALLSAINIIYSTSTNVLCIIIDR